MNPQPAAGRTAARAREISADVAVIGGGVIGHGIAWEARQSGRSVVLIDDAPGTGASWAAAGMLAPVSELHYQEEQLLELMLHSSGLWPAFAAGLEAQDTGAGATGTGYLTTSTLAVGADAADRRALADLRGVQQASGLTVEPLTVREARAREPLLSPGISCAFDIPADHQVDPRRLLALIAESLAGSAVHERAAGLLWKDGRVSGVSLAGGGTVHAGETIVANGLGSAALGGLPTGPEAAAPPGVRRHPAPACSRLPAAAGDINCPRHGPRSPRLYRSPAGRNGGDRGDAA